MSTQKQTTVRSWILNVPSTDQGELRTTQTTESTKSRLTLCARCLGVSSSGKSLTSQLIMNFSQQSDRFLVLLFSSLLVLCDKSINSLTIEYLLLFGSRLLEITHWSANYEPQLAAWQILGTPVRLSFPASCDKFMNSLTIEYLLFTQCCFLFHHYRIFSVTI